MAADPSTIYPLLNVEAFIYVHHDLEPEMEARPEEKASTLKANGTLCGATSLQFGRAMGRGGHDLCLEMEGNHFIESIGLDSRYCFSFARKVDTSSSNRSSALRE